jgi:hypothetical protein
VGGGFFLSKMVCGTIGTWRWQLQKNFRHRLPRYGPRLPGSWPKPQNLRRGLPTSKTSSRVRTLPRPEKIFAIGPKGETRADFPLLRHRSTSKHWPDTPTPKPQPQIRKR